LTLRTGAASGAEPAAFFFLFFVFGAATGAAPVSFFIPFYFLFIYLLPWMLCSGAAHGAAPAAAFRRCSECV
jgi:hypothetical protein